MIKLTFTIDRIVIIISFFYMVKLAMIPIFDIYKRFDNILFLREQVTFVREAWATTIRWLYSFALIDNLTWNPIFILCLFVSLFLTYIERVKDRQGIDKFYNKQRYGDWSR